MTLTSHDQSIELFSFSSGTVTDTVTDRARKSLFWLPDMEHSSDKAVINWHPHSINQLIYYYSKFPPTSQTDCFFIPSFWCMSISTILQLSQVCQENEASHLSGTTKFNKQEILLPEMFISSLHETNEGQKNAASFSSNHPHTCICFSWQDCTWWILTIEKTIC